MATDHVFARPPAFALRRRLLLAFGAFVAITVVCGTGGVAGGVVSRDAVAESHRFEEAARMASQLAVVAREQYIHEAHTIVARDMVHVEHEAMWIQRLEETARHLVTADPSCEPTVQRVRGESQELASIFAHGILPALDADDVTKVRKLHDRAIELVDEMTAEADALTRHFQERSDAAVARSDRATLLMLVIAAIACISSPLLALWVARRIWLDFTRPFQHLARVAGAVAGGDREARVGDLPVVELAPVGHAFDGMLDELERAEASLLRAERLAAVGRVAAGVAHEINNPIAVIRGYVGMLRKEPAGQPIAGELAILDEEAANCQRIAEELLTYASVPALDVAPVGVEPLVQTSVARVQAAWTDAGCAIAVNVEPAWLRLDEQRIRQVLVNLVRNACEATQEAGRTDPIELTGSRVGSRGYELCVADRGRGIPEELRTRVFEPFFTTRTAGTGLGLAVCYGLVTAHGGTIEARERPGGGVVLRVFLPDAVVPQPATAEVP